MQAQTHVREYHVSQTQSVGMFIIQYVKEIEQQQCPIYGVLKHDMK